MIEQWTERGWGVGGGGIDGKMGEGRVRDEGKRERQTGKERAVEGERLM